MKAIVITKPGGPEVLRPGEVATPEPGAGDIRVRVRAAGVNRGDLLQRRGLYPPPRGWPETVPGLEFAGEVEAVGRDVARWQGGERVMGLVGGGSYAEYAVVHEREAIAVPMSLTLEQAAAVPEAFITAHDALFTRLRLRLGEWLLVHAVGSGVGTAAAQLAAAAGARVIGTARSAWKLERATSLGVTHPVDASREDFAESVARITGSAGVDAILDLVGAGYFSGNLQALAMLGRMVVVGTVSGTATELDLRTLMRKRLTLIGTVLRARPLEQKIDAAVRFEREVGPLLEARRVEPVIDRVLPMREAGAAHRLLEANETFGKVVLVWD
ncbi:MAG: NAD(P)H-quinone oxidoreductase [Longimicrobiales bacterium]